MAPGIYQCKGSHLASLWHQNIVKTPRYATVTIYLFIYFGGEKVLVLSRILQVLFSSSF